MKEEEMHLHGCLKREEEPEAGEDEPGEERALQLQDAKHRISFASCV